MQPAQLKNLNRDTRADGNVAFELNILTYHCLGVDREFISAKVSCFKRKSLKKKKQGVEKLTSGACPRLTRLTSQVRCGKWQRYEVMACDNKRKKGNVITITVQDTSKGSVLFYILTCNDASTVVE